MFDAATLAALDRLIATLMTLVHAVAGVARAGGTYTFAEDAAHAVFHRLARLLQALARLATKGPTRRRKATDKSASPRPAADTAHPSLGPEDCKLRTENGWLLKALPDTAPAIAAEIGVLLSDPAFIALLASEPGLLRILTPLLRSLGLAAARSAPPPDAAPPATPDPSSAPAPLPRRPASRPTPPNFTGRPQSVLTSKTLRIQNETHPRS